MAFISIIVPCYNVEQYIDKCMTTLVRQTIGIENLQIILVNDASTDGTLKKLCDWEKKYPEQILVVTYEKIFVRVEQEILECNMQLPIMLGLLMQMIGLN